MSGREPDCEGSRGEVAAGRLSRLGCEKDTHKDDSDHFIKDKGICHPYWELSQWVFASHKMDSAGYFDDMLRLWEHY